MVNNTDSHRGLVLLNPSVCVFVVKVVYLFRSAVVFTTTHKPRHTSAHGSQRCRRNAIYRRRGEHRDAGRRSITVGAASQPGEKSRCFMDSDQPSNKTLRFHPAVKQRTFVFTGGSELFMTSEGLLLSTAALSRAGAGVTENRGRSCCHFLSTRTSQGKRERERKEWSEAPEGESAASMLPLLLQFQIHQFSCMTFKKFFPIDSTREDFTGHCDTWQRNDQCVFQKSLEATDLVIALSNLHHQQMQNARREILDDNLAMSLPTLTLEHLLNKSLWRWRWWVTGFQLHWFCPL